MSIDKKKIIYEDDEITIETTGKNYDFICTVENKSNDTIVIVFTGEYEYLEAFKINPGDWVGLLADDEGYLSLEAFENGDFYTIFEDDYEDEI